MNKIFTRKCVALVAAIGMLWMSFPAVAADTSKSSGSVSLQAKVINGEVYVKASSLTSSLGGTGSYNAQTGTYQYQQVDIPSVIQKVSPSVVAIIGKPSGFESDSSNRFNLAHGTGVIIKADGWIVTNAHVVQDMQNIVVVTADGKQYSGKKTHIDEESDLALVKINATKLPVAQFAAKSNIKVGETVIAIGTPISFSLRNSATVGVISGMNRSIESTYRLLQTDAAINPGNSGGPLMNLKGEVVGINSLKFVDASVDNMGFAIPSDTVQIVLNQFFKYGKVRHPSLGFEVEESWAAVVGLPSDDPLTITTIDEQSSAYSVGIRSGDVLYSVNGEPVTTIIEVNELLKSLLPGQKVQLMLQSGGDLVKREIVLSEQPS